MPHPNMFRNFRYIIMDVKLLTMLVVLGALLLGVTNGRPFRNHKTKWNKKIPNLNEKLKDLHTNIFQSKNQQPNTANDILQDKLSAAYPVKRSATNLITPLEEGYTEILELYDFLIDSTSNLYEKQDSLYEEYKRVRFNDSEVIISEPPVEGLPITTNLTLVKRRSMTEEDLLSVHYGNLMVYLTAMKQVYIDESKANDKKNFGSDMEIVIGLTMLVKSRLKAVMYELNINNIEQPEPIIFEPTDEASRNERDLYVLQEINEYIIMMLEDFPYLKNVHKTTPPPSEDLYLQYDVLIGDATVLAEHTEETYRKYKMDRNDGHQCAEQVIPGLPDLTDLPPQERLQMTEEQLLKIHHTNLHIYDEAMTHIFEDEQLSNSPNDFTEQFQILGQLIRVVISQEENVMLNLGTEIDQPPTNVIDLEPTDEAGRNARDCYILQEIDMYLPICLQDFSRFQSKYGAKV